MQVQQMPAVPKDATQPPQKPSVCLPTKLMIFLVNSHDDLFSQLT
jgi:hypothetical protein